MIGGEKMADFYGIGAYQQTGAAWNSQTTKKNDKTDRTSDKTTGSTAGKNTSAVSSSASSASAKGTGKTNGTDNVQVKEWNPIDTGSSLVPKAKEGYGMSIGNVQLSDKAKDYYNKLKSKFGNMNFILVSKDMKGQVQANAAAYGNASRQVVLIDDEKVERMANDESYRKKYEGIIAMSQSQMSSAKASITSSGAKVKNFGMSVNADGTTDFFATLEKSSDAQAKRIEKKKAQKKAEKAKEKKKAEKKEKEERLAEKKAEAAKTGKSTEVDDDNVLSDDTDTEYVEIHAGTMDELLRKISQYAQADSSGKVLTENEKKVGQHFDLKS